MKTRSFQSYIETRLSKEELAEIEAQAALEIRLLQSIQKMIVTGLDEYMSKSKIGFNELAKQLNWSPSKVAKVRRGEANLTLASLVHLFALLGKNPVIFLRHALARSYKYKTLAQIMQIYRKQKRANT